MSTSDLITVGLSETASAKLEHLKELGIFADKIDGYRFAVSLAIAQGVVPGEITKRTTLFNVGSLDPDQVFRNSVEALLNEQLKDTTVYRLVERLAEWGVNELDAQSKAGQVDFVAMLTQVATKVP